MADGRSHGSFSAKRPRTLPADLLAIVALTIAVNATIFVPALDSALLRVPLGIAFALFAPGYVSVAALFPERGGASDTDGGDADAVSWRSRIDGVERVALSFGSSIALVTLIGLALNLTPWGVRPEPIVLGVSGYTLVATAVAAVRRWRLPADDRFSVPYRGWIEAGRAELFRPDTRADAIVNVLLVAMILLTAGSVGYAAMDSPQDESYSAIYLQTEDEDGELVADDYPTEFSLGESQEVIVGLENHEQRPTTYAVVVVEQRVETAEDDASVEEQRELDGFETRLEPGETWTDAYDVDPTMTGEDVRIAWLLYLDGDVPDDPSVENADEEVHLWVEVTDDDEAALAAG